MKILIHAKNLNFDIESQSELLCTELEKSGHTVEWSNQTHPARLLLNKYDILHILTEIMPLTWKSFWLVAAAKALGIPVVVSSFGSQNLSAPLATVANFQLSYFDAMSVSEAGEIKNLRPFHHSKFIFSALFKLPVQKLKKNVDMSIENSSVAHIIFHVTKDFSDLPLHKWSLDKNIYIDGTKLALQKTQSEIRKMWDSYQTKNPIYKNAILILNSSNLNKILADNHSLFLINYLKLNSLELLALIENCLQTCTVLVLNENQASGHSEMWSSGRNGIVQNFEKSFTYQLSFTEMIEKSLTVGFEKMNTEFYESKINELSRIYAKIKTQKELKLSYANMSRRS